MKFKTQTSPYISSERNLSGVMLHVLIALIPGTLIYTWFFGYFVVINISIAVIFAIIFEALILRLRRRPIKPALFDLSAVVTAWLLALALPTLLPWWATVLAVFFAIVFAKHLYGGLGQNIFNPAMVGYVVVMISFPREMTLWSAPLDLISAENLRFVHALEMIFHFDNTHPIHMPAHVDALTMPTPLDSVKTALSQSIAIDTALTSAVFHNKLPFAWTWIALGFALGGIYLLIKRIITWHIPVTLLLTLTLISGVFYLIDSQHFSSPVFHLLSGAAVLTAFFIATDPVSAPISHTGKIIFAAGIALLIYIIRIWGGYPDGIAFAVILMNMTVPVIDYYLRTRPYGHPL